MPVKLPTETEYYYKDPQTLWKCMKCKEVFSYDELIELYVNGKLRLKCPNCGSIGRLRKIKKPHNIQQLLNNKNKLYLFFIQIFCASSMLHLIWFDFSSSSTF
jgi:DNA-directed RNA polymerase subunit RPC12/RpoP